MMVHLSLYHAHDKIKKKKNLHILPDNRLSKLNNWINCQLTEIKIAR